MEYNNPSENKDIESATPLTDDELKAFNEEVEKNCLLPVRNGLKDALDIILLTVKHFYRHFPAEAGTYGLSVDTLIDSIDTAISTAMMQVDEMSATELEEIVKHTNYVYDAFKLVEQYIPYGMLHMEQQSLGLPHAEYLRKVLDIMCIIYAPTMHYKGSDIGYNTAMYLKSRLVEYPNGKALCTCATPDSLGYKIYDNKPLQPSSVYPVVIFTLKKWADKNVDDNYRNKFFAFLLEHETDILLNTQVKKMCYSMSIEQSEDMCKFVYRWFLKEQASLVD